ncbi:MAG: hypothetical protein ACTSU9_07055 [Promethearchaeota archaeon]
MPSTVFAGCNYTGPGRYQLIPKEALTGYMIVLTPHPTWISGAKDNYCSPTRGISN